jgi:hypothetical protein
LHLVQSDEDCQYRPVQYLNKYSGTGSQGNQTPSQANISGPFWAAWHTITGYEAIYMNKMFNCDSIGWSHSIAYPLIQTP